MLWHHNIADHYEAVTLAGELQNRQESVACSPSSAKRQPPIARTSDTVPMVCAVDAMQAAGHEKLMISAASYPPLRQERKGGASHQTSALIISAALPGGEYLIALYRPDDYDPSVETEVMDRDIDVLNDEMVAAGVRVFVGGLSSAGNARSLRTQPNGNLLVTDGPYREAKEHLLGFWVVKAADLNEALAWGRKAAKACGSSVEVRPFAYSK